MFSLKAVSAMVLLAIVTACASTGATFGSGVGDALVEHPPYYAGARMAQVGRDTTRIGHLPVAYQAGAAQAPIFDPRSGAGSPVQALITEMNAYLDSLGVSIRVPAAAQPSSLVAPDVRFGCLPEYGAPGNDCAERGDSVLGRGQQLMQLSVGRPSPEWIDWANGAMDPSGSERLLVVTLEVGFYLLRQEGFAGTKVLELGTGYHARLPWLTSLETPVAVLQLTASLVDRRGRSIRIGAEGFFARRTPLPVSASGGVALVSDDDVDRARQARREDLPGTPLAWQVALRELVERVTGRRSSAP